MSLNDDVDQLIDSKRGYRPSLVGIGLFVLVTAACAFVCTARSSPPVIGEVKRFTQPQPEPHPALREITSVQPLVRSQPGDGPMCQVPIPEPYLPTKMELLLEEPATELEEKKIEYAITACAALRGPVEKVANPFTLLALFRFEEDLGAPSGLLVAAMCVESAMKPKGRYAGRHLGDWKDGVARASGPLQLHENVWGTTCGGNANSPHDLLWAAGCYWTEVGRVGRKAEKMAKCKPEQMLRVSEAAAANIRRYGWRCDSKSAHWGMMEAMAVIP